MISCAKFLVFIALLLLRSVDGRALREDGGLCQQQDLLDLGCKCLNPTTSVPKSKLACLQGGLANQLECSFSTDIYQSLGDQLVPVNYFDFAIAYMTLTPESTECWSDLYFENVLKITSDSFSNIELGHGLFANQTSHIRFKFKNVHAIEPFAFEAIALTSSLQELSIELDSPYMLEQSPDAVNQSLVLSQNSFAKIKSCKLLSLKNFVFEQQSALSLTASMFRQSNIETLSIEFSSFDSFVNDLDGQEAEFDEVSITNIVISNGFIDKIGPRTIPNLASLKTVWIVNSGVEDLVGPTPFFLNDQLEQLVLDNNLISVIHADSLSGLVSLRHLSLAYNPLVRIEATAFASCRFSVERLDLSFTKLGSLSEFYLNMSQLTELVLTSTHYLSASSISETVDLILSNSPGLKYLRLDDSQLIKGDVANMNDILTIFNQQLSSKNFYSLAYLDLTVERADLLLNATVFQENFNKQGDQLWQHLLDITFVKLTDDHPCNCPLLYLYKNVDNYLLPFKEDDGDGDFLNRYYPISPPSDPASERVRHFLSLMPKCYRRLWFQEPDRGLIKRLEIGCNFYGNGSSTASTDSTSTITDYDTGSTGSSEFSTTAVPTTTPPVTTTTEPFDQDQPVKVRKIQSKYTIPVIASVFAVGTLLIVVLIIKAKFNNDVRFFRNYQNNFNPNETTREPKEMATMVNPLSVRTLETQSSFMESNDDLDDYAY